MARITYSTGPVNNQTDPIYPITRFSTIELLLLNNSSAYSVNVIVRVFRLNGQKQLISSVRRGIGRNKSRSIELDVAGLDTFEIQVTIIQPRASVNYLRRAVLLSTTGFNEDGLYEGRLPMRLTL